MVYWTCNNIFSLAKNIFYKLRNPRKVAVILCAVMGTLLTLALFMSGVLNSRKKYAAVLLFECVALLPLILRLVKNTAIAGRIKIFFGKLLDGDKDEAFPISTFWLSGIFLTLLLGILIPAAVISASPHEFVDVTTYKNPLGVILYSTCYAAGFFLLWSGIICFMLNAKARNILCLILWILGGIFLTDYLFFGTRLGLISPLLEFHEGVRFLPKEKLLNLFCTTILTVGMFSLFRFKKVVKFVYAVLLISITGLSMLNIARAQKEFSQMVQLKNKETYHNGKSLIKLSRKNKNIIVLMIDRLPGGYIPYFFEQRPELEKQFKGFTFYPNTLSFGRYTNLCTPSLFGGYEYTPTTINARQDNTPLSRKHDEAIKVLPKIFSDEGYDVSVADIPYAGYKVYPDLSVYDEYPSVQKLYLQGMFSSKYRSYVSASSGSPHADGRTFFMYSLFKVFPVYISKFIYDNGAYWNPGDIGMTYCWTSEFIDSFSALKELPTITDTTDDSNGVFLMMATNAVHSATGRVFLHSPNFDIPYKKSEISDDMHEAIPETDGIRFDDKTLPTYHTGMATFVQLGIWFDWMHKNGVYDNTRIILVSDHGSSPRKPGLTGYAPFESMLLQNPKVDVSSVNPMLMVKDFGNVEFNTDISFMTNADVPSIALKDIVSEPVNPFTNKTISTEEKVLSPCMVTSSVLIDIKEHKGNGFTENGRWYSVHDNIFKEENWTLVE